MNKHLVMMIGATGMVLIGGACAYYEATPLHSVFVGYLWGLTFAIFRDAML